jgi:two-component system, NtrC family, response regulator AtoC
MKRVLVVDDERKMRRVLQMIMEQLGLESVPAETAEEALEVVRAEKIDLVVTDLKMPGMSGLECLRRLRELDPEVPVIMLTAHGTVQTAVEAMKLGAFDYVLKPFDVEAMEMIVRRALEVHQYRLENRYLRERADALPAFEDLIGTSPAMREAFELIRRVAPTKSAVLITGETGTGKELVARAIHKLSPRAGKLFVPLNCAAIPSELLESELFGHARGAFTGAQTARAGKFEIADGGSLFLDEIGDMAYGLQAKLLRVLQESVVEPIGTNRGVPVDVRVISSTNRDLEAAIRAGQFREDLFYRLNVFQVRVPPLRERPEDIEPLARFFLDAFSKELGKGAQHLAPGALAPLGWHGWPGNVRELQNAMERAVVLAPGPELDADFFRSLLPRVEEEPGAEAPESLQLDPAVEALERKMILRALAGSGDNKAEAARLLGVSERTLWYKLKKYRL